MRTRIQNLFLLFLVLCISSLGASSAQAQATGTSIVTVTITDVLLLAVAVPAVPIGVASAANYQDGTSFVATAQLTASSNRPYDIKVQSGGDLTNPLGTPSSNTIPIGKVAVQTSPTLSNTYSSALPLSSSLQTLITAAPANMAKVYDVKYTTEANSNAFYVSAGAYAATLTYSIVAN